MVANEHLQIEWLSVVQVNGLVVTLNALVDAEAKVTWPIDDKQVSLRELVDKSQRVTDLRAFFPRILDWSDEHRVSSGEFWLSRGVHMDGEQVGLSFAMRSAESIELLVQETQLDDLDTPADKNAGLTTPHHRFERLLRETGISIGLLTNGRDFRLVYAPEGDTTGWLTFRLPDMLTAEGRPLLGAFHMLLNESRVISRRAGQGLGDLLRASRQYRSVVSATLGDQLRTALGELLSAFEYADSVMTNGFLRDYLVEGPTELHGGLVTALMRMLVVLFAEENRLLPMDSAVYEKQYSLSGLYTQLQEQKQKKSGDVLDNGYFAWGRILELFRLLHDGGSAGVNVVVPAFFGGALFNPDAFPFLEGRPRNSVRQIRESLTPLRINDGVVYRVLEHFQTLDGQPLRYNALDVEQIASAFETLVGLEIHRSAGISLCLQPNELVADLEVLARLSGADRLRELKGKFGLELKGKEAHDVKEATTVEALHAALARRVSFRQPGLLPTGSLYLIPGEGRSARRVHTPRVLTESIVRTTLRPILEQFGPDAQPEQILRLKIADPAMGTGAFLIEACRQLAEVLVDAWQRTGSLRELPPNATDLAFYARRLIAERCLYGVDKDPLVVEMARLSLWLLTSTKDRPLTFLEHSLKVGDSLIGLSAQQIVNLSIDHAKAHRGAQSARNELMNWLHRAEELRHRVIALRELGDPNSVELRFLVDDMHYSLDAVRMLGDVIVACHFIEHTDKARQAAMASLVPKVLAFISTGAHAAELRGIAAELRDHLVPFHWEIEFPEVFQRDRDRSKGFDCVLGNPPFCRPKQVLASNGEVYSNYLTNAFTNSEAGSDLAAFFFRRAFEILREGGTLGLVAPNNIAQGATRSTGLGWICTNGGYLFDAQRHVSWPNAPAVLVNLIHGVRGFPVTPCRLDGRIVPRITSFLFHGGTEAPPAKLPNNEGLSFLGITLAGSGFIFDDENPQANPISEMNRLITKDPRNAERIFPYQGGEEINSSPTHATRRQVINLMEMTEAEARRWPDLMSIVESKVKPERQRLRDSQEARRRNEFWWTWGQYSKLLSEATRGLDNVLVRARLSAYHAITMVPSNRVLADSVVVFASNSHAAFAILQSTVHEIWAHFLGATIKDTHRYSITECFDTFPFPLGVRFEHLSSAFPSLDVIGRSYYDTRAGMMSSADEGLTKIYKRFHHPAECSSEIIKLRDLHEALNRLVLEAYEWTDIHLSYDFRPQIDESIRYTWDDSTSDEVLARLLDLNRLEAAKHSHSQDAATSRGKAHRKKRPPKAFTPIAVVNAPGEENSTIRRAEMLTRIETHDVEPTELDVHFAPRLNLFAGDNGLGKTFVLDLAWWALTGTWAHNPAIPRRGEKVSPTIWSEFTSSGSPRRVETPFDFASLAWNARTALDARLVLYARPDGGFEVWDAFRSRAIGMEQSRAVGGELNRFSLTAKEVWDELKTQDGTVLCNGLIRDWVSWQFQKPELFDLLTRVLAKLSPNEVIRPGASPRRLTIDSRDIPTIVLPYGEVPVTHASSGIRRILALAYILVWTWYEHTEAARLQNRAPLHELVLLIDEIDAHLHPTWQRVILPAIFQVFPEIESSLRVQVLVSTHSPLVLASAEPLFDVEDDVLLHFGLRDAQIVVEPIPWAKQGDAVNWLVSEAFGLAQARSREAEVAIEAAEAFMRGAQTPPELDTREKIHAALLRVLPGHDDFWPRWLVETGVVK